MKTTIKTGITSSVIVEPKGEGVKLTLRGISDTVAVLQLTQDQVGALLFGIEQAAEAAQIAAADRAKATA